MAAAQGGQILVSNTTAELLCDQMPQDAALSDLDEHHLKDLAQAANPARHRGMGHPERSPIRPAHVGAAPSHNIYSNN